MPPSSRIYWVACLVHGETGSERANMALILVGIYCNVETGAFIALKTRLKRMAGTPG